MLVDSQQIRWGSFASWSGSLGGRLELGLETSEEAPRQTVDLGKFARTTIH